MVWAGTTSLCACGECWCVRAPSSSRECDGSRAPWACGCWGPVQGHLGLPLSRGWSPQQHIFGRAACTAPVSSLQRTSCDPLPGSLNSAPEQGMRHGCGCCQLGSSVLSVPSLCGPWAQRGPSLFASSPFGAKLVLLGCPLLWWHWGVAEILNGHRICVLSGVLALHQALRGFSLGQGTAETGPVSCPSSCSGQGAAVSPPCPRELLLEQAGSSLPHSRVQVWE